MRTFAHQGTRKLKRRFSVKNDENGKRPVLRRNRAVCNDSGKFLGMKHESAFRAEREDS